MTVLSDLYTLGNAVDTYAPGHYARVFEAVDKRDGQRVAFKLMRPEHLAKDEQPKWEALAFGNEADLLIRMAALPGVMRLLDCGYVQTAEEDPRSGQIESFGLNIEQFRRGVFRLPAQQWRPYLALELLPRTTNLLYLMKSSVPTVHWRLPTEEGLDLAYQFADILRAAHRQNIVYLDHKLEHLHWDGRMLKVIDWNSSRLIDNGAQVLAQQINSDIHNMCVGILYPVFTGQSPLKASLHQAALRAMPGDQSTVESRYNEVSQLDFSGEPTLSTQIQDWLNRGAARSLTTMEQFMEGLNAAASSFGWKPSIARATRGEARQHLRDGLAKLRSGQELIKEARELIREAAILDDLGNDFEAELRRLLNKLNEMLSNRVIP